MDNASKALIIAGAILISVALVSLGVYLYSIGADAAGTSIAQIDALNMQMQNSNIQKYVGDKVKGSEVKQMVDYINAVNAADAMPTDVDIIYSASGEDSFSGTNGQYSISVRNSGIYKISIPTNGIENGYISKIEISKASATSTPGGGT